MQISKFKATCLAVLDRVAQTREPILITRRGEPIARIIPPAPSPAASWLGSMKDERLGRDPRRHHRAGFRAHRVGSPPL